METPFDTHRPCLGGIIVAECSWEVANDNNNDIDSTLTDLFLPVPTTEPTRIHFQRTDARPNTKKFVCICPIRRLYRWQRAS